MFNIKKLVDWLSGTGEEINQPQGGAEERRRFQRLHLENCRYFIGNEGPFSVSNLSYGGFRVDLSSWSEINSLQHGQEIAGFLHLHQIQLECRVEIRNIFGRLAGCSFVGLTSLQARIVSEFLKPRILGLSLREIDSAKLKNDDPELKMRWFQGEDGVQIFLWQTVEGAAVRQEFYFLDYFMAWQGSEGSLQTGKVKPENRSGFGRISPDSVVFFRIPPYRALKMGRTILECSKLPESAREKLLNEISGEEKRLFHRFIVKNEHIFFKPAGSDTELAILNISLKGIALLKPSETCVPDSHCCPGEVITAKQSIKVIFFPAYTHDNILGGIIKPASDADQNNLEHFLAPRLLAQYLEEVAAPLEIPTLAPAGARIYLYTGLHNTHILSLVTPDGELHNGRIAFMDRALTCRRGRMQEIHCPSGLIFPAEWEPENTRGTIAPDPGTLAICREMVVNAEIAPEVKKAWLRHLDQTACKNPE
ncbi:hypothetical protein MASR1M12_03250 [Erysipelotrichia bacterium]|jgi:hypothetical protein